GARVRDQRAGGLTVGRRSGLEELVVRVAHGGEVVLGERLCGGVVRGVLGVGVVRGGVIGPLGRLGVLGRLGAGGLLGVRRVARVLGVLRGVRVLALGVGGAVLL